VNSERTPIALTRKRVEENVGGVKRTKASEKEREREMSKKWRGRRGGSAPWWKSA